MGWKAAVDRAVGRARSTKAKRLLRRAEALVAKSPERQQALDAADRLGGGPAVTALLRKLVAPRSPEETLRRAERALGLLRRHEAALARERAAVEKWGARVARYRKRGVLPAEEGCP